MPRPPKKFLSIMDLSKPQKVSFVLFHTLCIMRLISVLFHFYPHIPLHGISAVCLLRPFIYSSIATSICRVNPSKQIQMKYVFQACLYFAITRRASMNREAIFEGGRHCCPWTCSTLRSVFYT